MTEPLVALDVSHQQAQVKQAAAIAATVLILWRQHVTADDLAGAGARRWLTRTIELILAGRRSSAQLASAYALAVRRLRNPEAPAISLPRLPAPNLEQIRKSLVYTGLAGAAKRIATIPERPFADVDTRTEWEAEFERKLRETSTQQVNEAMMAAGKAAAAAAVRHASNGARDFIQEVVRQDRTAVGFVRITRDRPCYFCAMLASRGPVYREDSFVQSDPRFQGAGEHKVHDSCQCYLRPVYSRSYTEWPPRSLDYSDLWSQTTGSLSGKEAIKAFRRAYEDRST